MSQAEAPRPRQERRQVNKKVAKDRRVGGERRKQCPQCHSPLLYQKGKTAAGSYTTLVCSRCEWKDHSTQLDMEIYLLKQTWNLPIEKRGPLHFLPLPFELLQALGLKEGDHLSLAPQTLPIGSLEMQWALRVQKKNERA